MKFDIDTFKVLSLRKRAEHTNYRLDNTELDKSACERDPGVMISRDLKPR